MKLEGIHHVTCDHRGRAAERRLLRAASLGLRLVKKSVNQDDPTVYHLFYARRGGRARRRHHVLRVPGGAPRPRRRRDGAPRRAGASRSDEALDFWEERLGEEGVADRARRARLRVRRPRGLALELAVVETDRRAARSPTIPRSRRELALQGFDGVRAYTPRPRARAARFLEDALGFEPQGDAAWEVRGERARRPYRYDAPPTSAASPAPAPCTTSPGPRRWTSTRPGASASPRPARARRP